MDATTAKARCPAILQGLLWYSRAVLRIARLLGLFVLCAVLSTLVVFEVERLEDKRRFALKVLSSRVDASGLVRFAREAQIAGQLTDENLISVVDLDVNASEGLYIVMELVEGSSLDDSAGRFGDLAWARPILRQIAHGLAVLHAHGIVHRDLKPANVLLSKGVAKIADFGISRLASVTANDPTSAAPLVDVAAPTLLDAALTEAGAILGTPMYMAPELIRGTREAPPSTDVFSFGIIAHELLVGRYPFPTAPIVVAGWTCPPLDLASLPRELADVVSRCLDADPARRPRAAELETLLS